MRYVGADRSQSGVEEGRRQFVDANQVECHASNSLSSDDGLVKMAWHNVCLSILWAPYCLRTNSLRVALIDG